MGRKNLIINSFGFYLKNFIHRNSWITEYVFGIKAFFLNIPGVYNLKNKTKSFSYGKSKRKEVEEKKVK